ncbi:J domain-containing protein [Haladaptatus sp. W1]|uniref:J domain-containing protein n=1 Tax=Haladaptatus sp. W1 TaxID=1897478 RepID=UPI000AD4949D|nr:DnaJ domain-containing protein [Haladaptatus sp. W1]
MHRSRLLLGIAAIFAGITVSMVSLGFAYNLVLVIFAVPFAITTGILWYHATGRLAKKVEREAYRESSRGFGPSPGAAREQARRQARERGRWQAAGRQEATGQGRGRTGGRAAGGRTTVNGSSGPSPTEAYRILGVDADADEDAVRQAYREKVKRVHPDRADGNEEAFKRVNRAYERVRNDR